MGLEMLSHHATQSVVPRPAAAAFPGSLWRMHILRHLQPTDQKLWG